METVPHVYFQDDDGINKVILPSTTGNELLVLHTQLGNYAAESTVLDIEADPAEIRTEDGTSFLSLNTLREATPSTITLKTIVDEEAQLTKLIRWLVPWLENVEDDSREISLKEAIKIKNDAVIGEMIETDSYTDKDKFIPFLRGRQEVLRDYHLDGWLVFDVPIDSKFSLLRWEISGDVIRIDL
tara:strand:- start:421 stop:975 length:555 start_codon:yes stop_codon:yes gene_type:complete